jgi:hypothetical protein
MGGNREALGTLRIELFAGHRLDFGESDLGRLPTLVLVVRPIRRHGVEGVSDRDNASHQRDRITGDTIGIAGAVPPSAM